MKDYIQDKCFHAYNVLEVKNGKAKDDLKYEN